jgi:hypothetical protein
MCEFNNERNTNAFESESFIQTSNISKTNEDLIEQPLCGLKKNATWTE